MGDNFAQEALSRLPLAEATLQAWRWMASDQFLADVFQASRGRCYERLISFATVTQLMSDALVNHHGNARRAFEEAIADESLPASVQAAYGKLRRLPVALSVALLNEATSRLHSIWPQSDRYAKRRWPPSLGGFDDLVVLDGKTIKRVMRRLKPLRKVHAGLLGGRAVAALSLRCGLIEALEANPDGHASEVTMAPAVVATLRRREPDARRLWVCDRGFCTQALLELFGVKDDAYLLRLHPNLRFTRDDSIPVSRGVDERGRPYEEDWGWLGTTKQPRRFAVRRIRLHRSDGKKKSDVVLITNLRDARDLPAVDLLELYLNRWGIEQVFQDVTEVFGLAHLIGTTPKAAIFQLAFCLLLYNIIQLHRAWIAEDQRRDASGISPEKLFQDVRDELISWSRLIGPSATAELIPPLTRASQVRRRLRQLFRSRWKDRWTKSPPRRNRGSKTRNGPQPGHHYGQHESVHRILQQHKRGD